MKRNQRNRPSRALLLALLLALLAACGQDQTGGGAQASGDQPITLRVTIWSSNEAHLALLNGIAEDYTRSHPTVSVKYDVIPFEDYGSKLTVQLAGGNPPDAGWIVENSAPTYIHNGVLADLAPTIKQAPDYNFADFPASALELWRSGEQIYGIPFSTSPFAILYNEDMFKSAGVPTPRERQAAGAWTWETLRADVKGVAAGLPAGTYGFESVDGAGYGDRVWHTLTPIVRAYGGEIWRDGSCTLNAPEAVKAVELYHGMIFADKSAVPPGEKGDFFSGRAALTVGQLSRVAKLKDAPFKWGIAPLPSGPAGESAVIGQAAFAVFKASAHKDAAADFIAFITNHANTIKLAQFFPPARASVLNSAAFLASNPLISAADMEQTIVKGIKQGRVMPSHVNFPKIDLSARAVFDTLWQPDADVQAVLNEACATIDPLLAQQ